MRALLAASLLVLVTLAPVAAAEFGEYDAFGYPLDVDGRSTFPGGVVPGGAATPLGAFDALGPVNVVNGVTVYPYWPVLTLEVERLASEHPDLVRLHSAGKSTLGLDLWMLEIANFAAVEAGEGIPLEEREVVWVDGGTHSNEYSGVYFAAHFASFLADEYGTNETATWIVDNRHTWVMPMVNPDGSNAFGRLNAKLVNINRNYPVVWDGEGNDPFLNNRGPSPASEIETQINIAWFNATRPDYYASVHCCGNLWLYPYGEEGVDPVDNEVLARVCEEAFPTVREDCGPIWSTIYPASGSSVDTAYEYTGAVAFGYEMSGRGAITLWGQPFTVDAVREQEVESWEGLLFAALNVHKFGAYPRVTEASPAGADLRVTVANEGWGNLTKGAVVLVLGSGEERRVDLPFIAPGGAATVTLPGPFALGEATLRVEYVKRVMAAPEGARAFPITFVEGDVAPAAEGVLVVQMPAGNGFPIPLWSPLAALAALAVAAGMRRRMV